MNPLLELREQGQSVWLDYISREILRNGEFAHLVREDGLGGVTSNPTIFEKAITHGSDYDDQLKEVLRASPAIDAQSLFEALALDDIRRAADLLRGLFERSGGSDGFVSFEVPAALANDTARTMSEARRLWKAIDRPNVMIKVPATREGIPAIEQLTAEGINVNITLMFSLGHYEQVAAAYIRGLERSAEPTRVASVASFFVSRVDTAVDKQLDRLGTPDALALRGRIAVANSKVVYQRFREIFYGAPFAALRARGCRVQRPLWASTSTKNPAYRDVLYVEELVARDTVNTMPLETIAAFRDHGRVRPGAAEESVDLARTELARLREIGVDLEAITHDLQVDGVAAFARSYNQLVAAFEAKRRRLGEESVSGQIFDLGSETARVDARLERWEQDRVCARIWKRDHTVWSPTPVPELTNRLGWLSMPNDMRGQIAGLTAFATEVQQAGVTSIVLLGMGGSSLAPEVYQATFGPRPGYPTLHVLDSTHPAAVRGVEALVDLDRTLFLVSSKSGGTSETNAFFQYFWSRYSKDAGRHFVAITDPGTSLERLAHERGFRRVFSAPPEVGGRYSALTVFGLVPAALIGIDLEPLIERAARMASSSAACLPARANPALALGAALGELALAGRDKLTLLASAPLAAFPAWLEQLIAESTGKGGKGIVPVADEPILPVERYGADRVFVVTGRPPFGAGEALVGALDAAGHPVIRITVESPADLGAEFFRWEFATAAAGAALGLQPFDQPDVQLAKELARTAMSGTGQARTTTTAPVKTDASEWSRALTEWLAGATAGDYVGVQAYLAPTADTTRCLQDLRRQLALRTGLATTLGYGPRFLHSTGQLHKGGPDTGLFLQIVDDCLPDVPVPETSYTFGQLIRAQAEGDAMALAQRGRRVLRIGVGAQVGQGLEQLAGATR